MKNYANPVRCFLLSVAVFLSTEQACCQVLETKGMDTATGLYETKEYRLKKSVANADFNYNKLSNIDAHIKDSVNLRSLMPLFNPVKGRFQYHQFIATFKGEGYRGISDFHDILIIKTTRKGKIIDAYQYTLEWAEPPLKVDLYKRSTKGLFLRDGMDISQLKFKKTYSWKRESKDLNEKGIVKLNKNQ